MPELTLDDVTLHFREDGTPDGPPIVFSNSLGANLHLWDKVVAGLPEGLRIIRYDKRGHGQSSVPNAPYSMGALISDAERLMDHLKIREAIFVGCSIGGMIAQGLATKRLDLIRGMVLSNTAAKIGTPAMWQERIDAVETGGVEALADTVMERWFSRKFRATPELAEWRNMLTDTPTAGYAGCSAAISGTDFFTTTAALRLPTLAIAGSEDGSTPPDLVRETAALIPGSTFHLIRGAGHLPCVEKPDEFLSVLNDFLKNTGHVTS